MTPRTTRKALNTKTKLLMKQDKLLKRYAYRVPRICKHRKQASNNKRLSSLPTNKKHTIQFGLETKNKQCACSRCKIKSRNFIKTKAHSMICSQAINDNTSNAPVKLHRSWFVLSRGITTDRTGIVGLYFAINLYFRRPIFRH